MTITAEMLQTHPAEMLIDPAEVAATVDALLECAEACTACADACLSEEMIDDLRTCIRLNMDCADICEVTARVVSRHTGADPSMGIALLQACVLACRACAQECGQHADMHEHCRICAESCRRCEEACGQMLSTLQRMQD